MPLISVNRLLQTLQGLQHLQKSLISNMSTLTLRMSEQYLAPTASRLPFMATRGVVARAARTAVLPRAKMPNIGARGFSSGPRVNGTRRMSRFVPTLATATAIGFGIYYYQKRQGPTLMDERTRECHACENETDEVSCEIVPQSVL